MLALLLIAIIYGAFRLRDLKPIFMGTLPFVAILAVAVVILSAVLGIAMWLPDLVYAK